ncbi:APC family permease [Streptococcus sp. X16XC17]|uniref:APC family permease n=1 Tax=unclassified Streptococcus TaxID=2608887 RepID=UPI00066FB5D5|nr:MULTISPECIES: APC family permease [unclassified Streptococcus]TCD45708.1 APC family permease [Streptococcus sp. X16XC17]
MKKHEIVQTYGLTTAIAMIVGVVIGSGIYFKVDDILVYAGGNVWLGMLVIALGSFAVVFGSLGISELATRHDENGGIFSYYARYISPGLAASLGLFSAYVYLPTVIAVVAWVAANFTLGSQSSLEAQTLLAALYLVILTFLNIYSKMLAGYFQSLSTLIKIVPLLAIALVGLFWQGQAPQLPQELTPIEPRDVGFGWLSALMPLYFAYDGWTVVANIAPEIKNPKRNLSRAFIIGPMLILVLYLIFFYGLTQILGPTYIMTTGNDAVIHATNLVYGPFISKILLVIIIIAVLGVSNGMLLATMRLPQAFAERGWIKSEKMAKIHLKYQLSVPASLSVAGVTLVWLGIHYLVSKFNLLPRSDISEITIVFNNTCFIFLYFIVLRLFLKGEIKNRLTGFVAPILAIISAITLLVGSLLTNFATAACFLLVCLGLCLISFAIYKKNTKGIN